MKRKKILSSVGVVLSLILINNYFITSSSYAQTQIPNLFATATNNILTLILQTNGQVNNNDFGVVVINNQDTKGPFTPPGNNIINLQAGAFNVRVNQISTGQDVTFTSGVTLSGDCSGTVQVTMQCTVLITSSVSGGTESSFVSPGNAVGGAETNTGASESAIGPGITAATAPNTTPIRACKVSNSQIDNGNGGTETQTITPTSATYDLTGRMSFSSLKKILTDTDSDQVIFEITYDLNSNDPALLSATDNLFRGLIYSRPTPFNDDSTFFSIDSVTTQCKFLTLQSKPTVPVTKTNNPAGQKGVPLGVLTKSGDDNVKNIPKEQAASEKHIFTQNINPDAFNVGDSKNIAISAINPPFRDCSGLVDKETHAAKYFIRGDIQRNEISNLEHTHTVDLKLVVDTNQVEQDQAFLINNNNQFIKVNLVVDPDSEDPKILSFKPSEISTSCLGIGFSESPLIS
jgi:hypothetical protein